MSSYFVPGVGGTPSCVVDGTVANPAWAFCSELTTGRFRPGAGIIAESILGVERFRLDASNAQFNTHAIPGSDGTNDLGSSSRRWRDLFLSRALIVGTNPATAGAARFANNDFARWRNAANTLNAGWGFNASDNMEFDGNGLNLSGSATFLRIGTNPAASGIVRVPYQEWLRGRNSGNTADVDLVRVDTATSIKFGSGDFDADFTGVLVRTQASKAGAAGLRLPHGAAPTAPVDGDLWTTTAGLFVRINGATVGPLN